MTEETTDPQSDSSRAIRAGVWMILAAALAVRVAGLFYGLPYTYDEQEQRMVNIALKIGATKSLDTQFLLKGILPWILVAEFGVYYLVGRVFGVFASAEEFAKSYFVDASPFYLIERLNQAAAGVLCVWVMWRLASKLFGRAGGLWAMALAAFCAPHIILSRSAVVDLYNALFATLALNALYDYDWNGRLRDVILAAFWCAASASAKLTGGVILLGVLGLLLSRGQFKRAAVACLVFGAAFILLTPPLWVNAVWNLKSVYLDSLVRGASRPEGFPAWEFLKTIGYDMLSLPGLAAFFAGWALSSMGGARFKWLALAVPFAVASWFNQRMAPTSFHYFMTVWPILILAAAGGIVWFSSRTIRWILGGAVLASQFLFMPGSLGEIAHPRFQKVMGCETYDAAKGSPPKIDHAMQSIVDQMRWVRQPLCTYEMIGWIKANLPRGTKIYAMDGGTWKNRLFPMPGQIRDRLKRFEGFEARYVMDYNLGNQEMYKWLLKIVESDTSVPAYEITYVDIRTETELADLKLRSTVTWIENILPYDHWSDLSKADVDYFLFIDWPTIYPERFLAVETQLERTGPPVASFLPFSLYRLRGL